MGDVDKRERQRELDRERYQRKRLVPGFLERQAEYQAEYREKKRAERGPRPVVSAAEWAERRRLRSRERYRARVESEGKVYRARDRVSADERREREREYQADYYKRRRLADPGWRRKSREG